ncbi:SpaH/EbpB family LPXTG-anchored major pilin [Gardnerella sp. Marseille-Q9691]|uniref:SpaH/EbpB family LPXTG-anchored major pilin n=1 Tax=Gardnerella sp. Marseille-Q9691 TaxID=3390096 RepID=UPI0039706CE6
MKKFTNKFVAAVASLAMAGTLCVAGAVTVSGVAWAAGPKRDPNAHTAPAAPAPWEQGAPKNGTITILKCVEKKKDGKATSSSNTPTGPQCKAGYEPLNDATFKLTKVTSVKEGSQYVTLDLSKFESWQKIAKLVTKLNDHTITDTGADAEVKLDTNNVIGPKNTDKDGIAKFGTNDSPIDLGLYKVEETNAPKGYGVSDLQSFYMTLPLPEYTTTKVENSNETKTTVAYNYNPTVKPKNKDLSTTIQKVYDKTKFASVKDKVPFTITAGVNIAKRDDRNLTANDLQGYKVFDDAPTAAFKTIDASVVKKVKINGKDVTNDTTTTYYKVEDPVVNSTQTDKANDDATENQRGLAAGHTRISVKFEKAGLDKIAEEINGCKKAGDTIDVEVDLEFELNSDYQTGTAPTESKPMSEDDKKKDEIVNKSGFFPAHQKDTSALPPIIPENKKAQATIDFGFLNVHKYYMKDGKQEPLKDAEFRIFADEKKANACAQGLKENKELSAIEDCKVASTINDATANAGSQPAGAATTDVQTAKTNDKGNFAKAYKTRASVPVYLVEVKAPKGYAISPVVHAVTVTKDQTKTEEFEDFPLKGGEDGKSFWFNLPATGAAGVILFALAGMGLIAASVFLYMRNRKEEEQQQNA